jgi:uncharacterized protein (DUF952 family)
MSRPAFAWKVLTADEVAELKQGSFAGSAADRADGYIHLSGEDQLTGTLDKHYAGQDGLWVACVDLTVFGEALRWEESRGGALFPHLYAPLPLAAVVACAPLERRADGSVKPPFPH